MYEACSARVRGRRKYFSHRQALANARGNVLSACCCAAQHHTTFILARRAPCRCACPTRLARARHSPDGAAVSAAKARYFLTSCICAGSANRKNCDGAYINASGERENASAGRAGVTLWRYIRMYLCDKYREEELARQYDRRRQQPYHIKYWRRRLWKAARREPRANRRIVRSINEAREKEGATEEHVVTMALSPSLLLYPSESLPVCAAWRTAEESSAAGDELAAMTAVAKAYCHLSTRRAAERRKISALA